VIRRPPATEHVASCYAVPVDGVLSGRHIEIRFDRTVSHPAYVITTICDRVAESAQRRGSRASAIRLAAALGYPEVVWASEVRS
jgi:hypothetical protein